MADATALSSAAAYDVKVEDVGGARKRLTITIPPQLIDEKIEESMGTLAGQTALPGFRKGRAPRALLERRFGPTLRRETKSQLIAESYARAIEEKKIKPLGEPEPVRPLDEIELEPGKALTFEVEVEVVPEFELPKLDAIKIIKPVLEVTNEHIEAELTRQRTQYGNIVAVDSGFEPGDRLLGPGSVTKEGETEPFFRHDNVDIIVPPPDDDGRGHVLGLMIAGLGAMIAGRKVGDHLEFDTVGPDSHELEHIRGKKLHIEVTIRDGQRIVPCAVEQVMAQYGMDSEAVLREQIKFALEQRRDAEQRAAMREQVCQQLVDAVDFELPRRLTDAQAGRLLERYRLELMHRGGLSVDEVEQRLAEMRSETQEQSRQRLKLTFLLHRLADQFGIKVTDQEINGRIAQIAAQRGMRPEKLRADLVQAGAIGSIASQIREHKAADRVIDQSEVTEMSAQEWNAQAVAGRAARRAAAGASSSSAKKSGRKGAGKKGAGGTEE
jgi:trigger factor